MTFIINIDLAVNIKVLFESTQMSVCECVCLRESVCESLINTSSKHIPPVSLSVHLGASDGFVVFLRGGLLFVKVFFSFGLFLFLFFFCKAYSLC